MLRHDFHDGLGFSCVYIMLFGDLFYDSLSRFSDSKTRDRRNIPLRRWFVFYGKCVAEPSSTRTEIV